MSKKAIKKEFTLFLSIKAEVDVTIAAESFEDALIAARELKVPDIISAKAGTGLNDYEVELTGVFK